MRGWFVATQLMMRSMLTAGTISSAIMALKFVGASSVEHCLRGNDGRMD